MQHIDKWKISFRKYRWGEEVLHLAKRHKPLHCWLNWKCKAQLLLAYFKDKQIFSFPHKSKIVHLKFLHSTAEL